MKFSAREVKNLVNLWARIRSMSSACLILMLRRTELTDDSIRTCSFSFRAICMGFKIISGDVLQVSETYTYWKGRGLYLASTSGMLCRSTTWLEKFWRHNAAVRLARTQFKYGRSVFDYQGIVRFHITSIMGIAYHCRESTRGKIPNGIDVRSQAKRDWKCLKGLG